MPKSLEIPQYFIYLILPVRHVSYLNKTYFWQDPFSRNTLKPISLFLLFCLSWSTAMLGWVSAHPYSSSMDSLKRMNSGIVLPSPSKFLHFGGFLESILVLEMPLQTSFFKSGEVHVKVIFKNWKYLLEAKVTL